MMISLRIVSVLVSVKVSVMVKVTVMGHSERKASRLIDLTSRSGTRRKSSLHFLRSTLQETE